MVNDGLTPLPGHSPGWLGRAAPRCRADANKLIPDTKPLRFCIEAIRAEIAPAVLHDQAPGLFGLDLIGDEVPSPAFLAERGHFQDLGSPGRSSQPTLVGFS
jgi:hypothetical protein